MARMLFFVLAALSSGCCSPKLTLRVEHTIESNETTASASIEYER